MQFFQAMKCSVNTKQFFSLPISNFTISWHHYRKLGLFSHPVWYFGCICPNGPFLYQDPNWPTPRSWLKSNHPLLHAPCVTSLLSQSHSFVGISFKKVISEKIVHLIRKKVSTASRSRCVHVFVSKKKKAGPLFSNYMHCKRCLLQNYYGSPMVAHTEANQLFFMCHVLQIYQRIDFTSYLLWS